MIDFENLSVDKDWFCEKFCDRDCDYDWEVCEVWEKEWDCECWEWERECEEEVRLCERECLEK